MEIIKNSIYMGDYWAVEYIDGTIINWTSCGLDMLNPHDGLLIKRKNYIEC